ncbi:MAG: hypothetical protein AUH81_13715 [Candidatus Rokubacteria bacterium 13_1_40CM_4_69_5]|nr:MAG: hypothetical protein AUH81_13715 [Candidatus Rokubacteria bacterium 13_1_40CM_4_69_5]
MPTPTDVVEALLFASDTPLEAARIREVLDLPDVAAARGLLEELRARYAAADSPLSRGCCGWPRPGRAPASRVPPWRRSPSSPTANRCRARKLTRFVA